MLLRIFFVSVILFEYTGVWAQEKFAIIKDFRSEWMTYEENAYTPVGDTPFTSRNTLYFKLVPHQYPGSYLRLSSHRPFFVLINGQVAGEFQGEAKLSVDSLRAASYRPEYLIAIHQEKINERDLKTQLVSMQPPSVATTELKIKPYSDFRDFVVVSGLIIILLFLVTLQLNPKLAADYFSISRIFSSREAEDSQSSARLTSSSNVQFYVLCSLLISFYLLIILRHLPQQYALPLRFNSTGFWMTSLQWLKLSTVVFSVFLLKMVIIFCMTRLFGMHGMARFHFFNWIRVLLITIGTATIILFIYFISRGDSTDLFVLFLSLVIVALTGWIMVAFFKLSGRSGHSMFHLFSYLCATEIIPLLITFKVLFQ